MAVKLQNRQGTPTKNKISTAKLNKGFPTIKNVTGKPIRSR